MSLVRLENVKKTHEPQLILDNVSWQIAADDRMGLIGANGTGKTTLVELVAGRQEPTTGRIYWARGLKIGYLSQQPEFDGELTVRETMEKAFEQQRDLEAQMLDVSQKMSEAKNDAELERLLEQYDRLQHRHETEGGYNYEHRIDSILMGLGFAADEFDKRVEVLSGGQKNRAALAKLLLEQPLLLLLDEPTNHLDIRAIEWLESFLTVEFQGAYVVVSHDRYFLDKVTKKTVEIRNHQLTEYRGNYSQYLKTRELNVLSQQREYEKQQEYIAKAEEYVRRNLAGQNTKQAQGVRTRLARLERIERPDTQTQKMKLRFEADARGGDDVLAVSQLSKEYDGRVVFRNLTFDLSRADVLGIMGPNGAGKTTLFRVLRGQEPPTDGSYRWGSSLTWGYLDQEQRDLNNERTVLNEMWACMHPATPQGEVRSYLARFYFRGDDIDKYVGNLSGGERTRLALAKLLLQKANVLLLDEPTNHLDIPSREILEEALMDFPATLLLISHDRYLLSKLATKLLIFEDGGKVRFWKYSYDEWEQWKQDQERKERLEKAGLSGAEGKKKTPAPQQKDPKGKKKPPKKPKTMPAGRI